jgi:hypothetical protein
MNLFPLPTVNDAPASEVYALYTQGKFSDAAELARSELAALEDKVPPRTKKPPQHSDPGGDPYQYYALTVLLVNALAELDDWKAAKEALGKYRVRFPRDPWGFEAGALVQRRDPAFKDKATVDRAADLLEQEARRLRGE